MDFGNKSLKGSKSATFIRKRRNNKKSPKLRDKLSPRKWRNKNKIEEKSDFEFASIPSSSSTEKQPICCWELTDINDKFLSQMKSRWQSSKYIEKIKLPKRLKYAKPRYLYKHDEEYAQIFEIYDTGKRLYLLRWAGPNPLEVYTRSDGKSFCPFNSLWHEFVNRFEPKTPKRVYVHSEEIAMDSFLHKLRYAQQDEEKIGDGYELWFIHDPENYTSSGD